MLNHKHTREAQRRFEELGSQWQPEKIEFRLESRRPISFIRRTQFLLSGIDRDWQIRDSPGVQQSAAQYADVGSRIEQTIGINCTLCSPRFAAIDIR